MGILDDAIREHLELKRRRGADAGEVARQEREALGPARRDVGPLETPPAAPEDIDADPVRDAPPALHEPPPPRVEAPEPTPPPRVEPLEPTPPPRVEPLEPTPPPPVQRAEPTPPPRVQPSDPIPPSADVAVDRTVEPPPHRPAQRELADDEPDIVPADDEPDIVPADEEPEGEELLEETPEFLEETPEHDRLWFEQRPPRDFDFDD